KDPDWAKHFAVHALALALCLGILVVTVFEKFTEGGWVTLVVTALTIIACWFVRVHYRSVARKLAKVGHETEDAVAKLRDQPRPAGRARARAADRGAPGRRLQRPRPRRADADRPHLPGPVPADRLHLGGRHRLRLVQGLRGDDGARGQHQGAAREVRRHCAPQ